MSLQILVLTTGGEDKWKALFESTPVPSFLPSLPVTPLSSPLHPFLSSFPPESHMTFRLCAVRTVIPLIPFLPLLPRPFHLRWCILSFSSSLCGCGSASSLPCDTQGTFKTSEPFAFKDCCSSNCSHLLKERCT